MLNCFERLRIPFLRAVRTERAKSLYRHPYRQSRLSGISQPSGRVHRHLCKAEDGKRSQTGWLASAHTVICGPRPQLLMAEQTRTFF